MTETEVVTKLNTLYRQWRSEVVPLSLKELKDFIKATPRRAVLHELELNRRLNGGVHPIHVIASKMCQTHNYKKIAIDEMITFGIFK